MSLQSQNNEKEGKADFIHLQWFAEEDGGEIADTDPGDTIVSGEGVSEGVTESGLAGWTSIFPKEYLEKHKELLSGLEKPRHLFDRYLEMSEKQKAAIIQPGEDATDDERKSYLKALGVPESKDQYELPKLDKAVEESLGDVKGFNEWYKDAAHSFDMTKAQAEGFYKLYVDAVTERTKGMEEARSREAVAKTEALKKEWGDKSDGNFELAKRAFKSFTDDEFNGFMKESGLAEDPRMIKVFYKIAQKISGDTLEPGSLNGDFPEADGLRYPAIREKFPESQE